MYLQNLELSVLGIQTAEGVSYCLASDDCLHNKTIQPIDEELLQLFLWKLELCVRLGVTLKDASQLALDTLLFDTQSY